MDIIQDKKRVYTDVANYFGNITLTKLASIPRQVPIGMYYARIGCLLCDDNQYIVALVEGDNTPIGNTERLSDLKWISFQTRMLDKLPNKSTLSSQEFKSVLSRDTTLTDKIQLQERREDRCVYHSTHYPIQIELLIEKENDVYSESGTIRSALDTYACVITFLI
jgi:hypothetical protein